MENNFNIKVRITKVDITDTVSYFFPELSCTEKKKKGILWWKKTIITYHWERFAFIGGQYITFKKNQGFKLSLDDTLIGFESMEKANQWVDEYIINKNAELTVFKKQYYKFLAANTEGYEYGS